MMENGDYYSRQDFEKVFTKLEKNTEDISSCRKLGRHLLIKKGSQDRQVPFIYYVSISLGFFDPYELLYDKNWGA